jgi:DNA repair exonuclease SbcCD nuclease subunit
MAFIPWLTEENQSQFYSLINEPGVQIAFGHLEVSGFEMHSGIMSQIGISKTIFNKFDMVMSGHFHKRSTDGHIYYLGCPYEMTWADCNDPKGFHVFDTETRTLEFIPNERRIFEKIHYNDKTTNYSEVDVSQYDQKFIKVFVENRDDYYAFDKFLDRLYNDIAVWDLKVVEDFSDLSVDFVSDSVVEDSQDTLSLLDLYVSEIDTTLDKNRIKDKLKSLYIEAGDLEL